MNNQLAETKQHHFEVARVINPNTKRLESLIQVTTKDPVQLFASDELVAKYVDIFSGLTDDVLDGIDPESPEYFDIIRSRAAELASTKARWVDIGKLAADSAKALPRIIDRNRRESLAKIESAIAEFRKPLTDFEEEQARIKAENERIAAEKAEHERKCREIIDGYQEVVFDCVGKHSAVMRDKFLAVTEPKAEFFGVLFDEAVAAYSNAKDKLEAMIAQAEAAEQAAAKLEMEREAARQMAEVARRLEEEKARAELERIAEAERVVRAKLEAEVRSKAAEDAAKERAEAAEARARAAEEAARNAEKQAAERAAAEVAKREREEIAAKEAAQRNKEHLSKVLGEVKNSLMSECYLDEDTARNIVNAIRAGKIARVTINIL